MHSPDPADSHRPLIAIIGGGASGTLTAIHLLRLATVRRWPMRIALIDRDGRHGLGQAYSTTHPGHLLNSPAGTMSAVAGDPGQLLRWARANRIAHDGFLRRADYGATCGTRSPRHTAGRARPPSSPRSLRRWCGSPAAPSGTRCGSTSRPMGTSTPAGTS